MNDTLEPQEGYEYIAVSSTRRVYIIFSKQVIPLWTWLLRKFLARYQGFPVNYTHCLLAVAMTEEDVLYMYEMDFYEGMNVHSVDYNELYYENQSEKLVIVQENHYGLQVQTTYDALDVTSVSPDGDTVDSTWWMSYTPKRLTPLTLFKHMLPHTVDRETWTCSGIVEALLGASRTRAYLKPRSPDQLYRHYKEQ